MTGVVAYCASVVSSHGTASKGDIVIGIAFVASEPGVASVRELLHFDARNWTPADDERAAK